MRYVFDVPDQISVSADRAKERLTLTFDAPIPFDLADAEAALPAAVAAINAEVEQDSAWYVSAFSPTVDVRTFRDGKGYVVDIVKGDAATAMHEKAAAAGAPPRRSGSRPLGEAASDGDGKAELARRQQLQRKCRGSGGDYGSSTRVQPRAPEPAPAARAPANSAGAAAPAALVRQQRRKQRSGSASPPAAPELAPPAARSTQPTPPAAAAPAAQPVTAPEPPPAKRHASSAASLVQRRCSSHSARECCPARGRTITAENRRASEARRLPIGFRRCCRATAASGQRAASGARSHQPTREVRAPEGAPPRRGSPEIHSPSKCRRQGANLKLSFPFATPTAAAVFQSRRYAVDRVRCEIRDRPFCARRRGQPHHPRRRILPRRRTPLSCASGSIIRTCRASRPKGRDGPSPSAITLSTRTRALDLTRNLIGPNRASVTIPFEQPHQLHRISRSGGRRRSSGRHRLCPSPRLHQ